MSFNEYLFVAGDWSWWTIIMPPLIVIAITLFSWKWLKPFQKWLCAIVAVVSIVTAAWAADTKLSALTELATTPAASDEFYVNDGGTSKKIQYSNVVSATVIAAAIAEGELADSIVVSADIKDGTIAAADLGADIIDETKLADDSIDSEHYNDGSIDAVHLAADIIDETKIADDGIDSEHYNDGSIDAVHLSAGALAITTNSKAANYTIGTDDAKECYGGVIYVTSTCDITACDALAAGMAFTVITIGATQVDVDVQADDKMILDGTTLDDGDKAVNTSTTGDSIVCTYYSADGWYCMSGSPDGDNWTDGS